MGAAMPAGADTTESAKNVATVPSKSAADLHEAVSVAVRTLRIAGTAGTYPKPKT